MKKFKFFVAAAAIVAGLASAVSCQDLSKEIEDLSSRVSALENQIASLQQAVGEGIAIKKIESTANGLTIYTSDGNTWNLKNGENGKNGSNGKDADVWTIGNDGYWYKNGSKSDYKAVGENGNVWKVEEGYFVEYKDGKVTGNKVKIADEGVLTAVMDEDGNVTITGVKKADGTYGTYVIKAGAAAPTAISLVDAYESWNGLTGYYTQGINVINGYMWLAFSDVTEKANVFEEGIANAITFVEGKLTPTGSTLVVRISPANYVPVEEDFQFVNSLGMVYENIQVTNIKPYVGLLAKSVSLTDTGLWALTVELKDYDKDEFDALANLYDEDDNLVGRINYAVKCQEAVSTYDINLWHSNFEPDAALGLYVGDQNIDQINNRYAGDYASWADCKSLILGGEPAYPEQKWAAFTKKFPTPWTEMVKTKEGQNYADDADDDRALQLAYQANLNEDIVISAVVLDDNGDVVLDNGKPVLNENVAAMYVTFDYEKNAVESAPSEWNAWKSYEANIEGLNTVVEGNQITINIKDAKADGDYIGFRVFAANLDGTLLDPDGRAFYVLVGKSADAAGTIATEMKKLADFKAKKSGEVEATFAASYKEAGNQYTFVMDDKDAPKFKVTFSGKELAATTFAEQTEKANWTIDAKTIQKAYTEPVDAANLWKYEDGKTYSATLTIFNKDGRTLLVRKVTFTKTLPTDVPAGYSVKTNQQDANGVYRCFLVPEIWTAEATAKTAPDGQKGTMEMESVFNFPTGESANYLVVFADSKIVKKDGKDVTDTLQAKGNGKIAVKDLKFIDNATQHATTVSYNYGKISSALVTYNDDKTVKSVADYMKQVDQFPTIYYCIYNDDATVGFKWNWKTMTQAEYTGLFNLYFNIPSKEGWAGVAQPLVPGLIYEDFVGPIPASYITGKSGWDSKYQGTVDGGYLGGDNHDKKSLAVISGKFVTATDPNKGKEEYYKVTWNAGTGNFEFAAQSGATNPVDKVSSKLVVTCNDMYGHEVIVEVPAYVIKR